MAFEFDYYGILVKYEVEGDPDGVVINILSTSLPIEDDAEERDIKFHCSQDYSDRATKHYIKTGDFL